MYKLLLCTRYLRTRFLAFVCIGSVMLGVATLIVVNSVMSGFSTKLRDRLHKLLSDVVIESPNVKGFPMPVEEMIKRIQASPAGQYVEAMAPTIETVAMLQFRYPNGEQDMRPVHLVGCDPVRLGKVGGFDQYLMQPERRANPSFKVFREAMQRYEFMNPPEPRGGFVLPKPRLDDELPEPEPVEKPKVDPQGIVIGYALATVRETDPKTGKSEDVFLLYPGDVVQVMALGVGKEHLEPVHAHMVVCDYIKTELGEQDSGFVFVDLGFLQRLRGMHGKATSVQIKLTDYAHAKFVVEELKRLFPARQSYNVMRWEDKQSGILSAIDVERGILNILLFLIVGVAGFGILAIFSMIVVEKTRDIGILKSLGASNRGIMSIFLAYGLLLGVVGSVLGTLLGICFVRNINGIEQWLSRLTGHEVFPRNVYYFDEIPTDIQAMSVGLIDVGAVAIAVFFSILPAFKAAMLNPVKALRYE